MKADLRDDMENSRPAACSFYASTAKADQYDRHTLMRRYTRGVDLTALVVARTTATVYRIIADAGSTSLSGWGLREPLVV
jgi:hypothetical protein